MGNKEKNKIPNIYLTLAFRAEDTHIFPITMDIQGGGWGNIKQRIKRTRQTECPTSTLDLMACIQGSQRKWLYGEMFAVIY